MHKGRARSRADQGLRSCPVHAPLSDVVDPGHFLPESPWWTPAETVAHRAPRTLHTPNAGSTWRGSDQQLKGGGLNMARIIAALSAVASVFLVASAGARW